MYKPVEKTPEQKSQSFANTVSQRQNSNTPTSRFVDNRPEAIQMRRLRELAKNSPQDTKLRELHNLAAANSVAQKKSNMKQGFAFVDNRPEVALQRKILELANNSKCNLNTSKPPIQRSIYEDSGVWKSTRVRDRTFSSQGEAREADIAAGGDGQIMPMGAYPSGEYVPPFWEKHPGRSKDLPRRERRKEYVVPYDRSGQMVLPIKHVESPYGGMAFGGGMPALPGGNVGVRDQTPADTVRREVLEEMGPFGFRLRTAPDPESSVHSHRDMTFREGTVRPTFGATPSEIPTLPPEFREMERFGRIDPSILGVTQRNTDYQIMNAIARTLDVDSRGDQFHQWIETATAQAIVKSIRPRLPS